MELSYEPHQDHEEWCDSLQGHHQRCDQARCMPRWGSRIASRAKGAMQRASRALTRQYHVRTYSPPKQGKVARSSSLLSKSKNHKLLQMTPKQNLVRIDSQTEIPEDVYNRMLQLASDSSKNGTHTLVYSKSGPFLKAASRPAASRPAASPTGPRHRAVLGINDVDISGSTGTSPPGAFLDCEVTTGQGGLAQQLNFDKSLSRTTSGLNSSRAPLLS